MRYLLAAIILIAFPVVAEAQDGGGINWRSVRQRQWVCRDFGGCGYEWRWRRVRIEPRYYAAPRYDDERWERRDSRLERGEHCNAEPIRVVGEAHLTKEGALNSAVRQWQSSVRYDWGEKRMDIENARDYRWRCDRASTNETALGKIGETLSGGNAFQRRCVVIATPCQTPVIKGDRDDR